MDLRSEVLSTTGDSLGTTKLSHYCRLYQVNLQCPQLTTCDQTLQWRSLTKLAQDGKTFRQTVMFECVDQLLNKSIISLEDWIHILLIRPFLSDPPNLSACLIFTLTYCSWMGQSGPLQTILMNDVAFF